MKSWDVIISGAGIIGVSLALELRAQGERVLVLDRGEPGREASSAAAGMLAPADPETPPALRKIAAESARLFPEYIKKIEAAAEMKVDFRRQGTIALLESASAPREYKKLFSADLQGLEPALKSYGHPAFFVQEDSVDPDLLIRAALSAAQKRGIEIRGNTVVKEMRAQGSGVEVITEGDRLLANAAVNCQGAWSGAPVKPRKGQMLYVQPSTPLLQHVVRTPDVYIVPRSSGKILVGATVEDVGYEKTVETSAIQKLLNAAAQYVPELTTTPIVQSWAGLRPGTPDDLPILGPMDAKNIFVASGHFRNGILLAPVTATVMADWLINQVTSFDLSAFSPLRFSAIKS